MPGRKAEYDGVHGCKLFRGDDGAVRLGGCVHGLEHLLRKDLCHLHVAGTIVRGLPPRVTTACSPAECMTAKYRLRLAGWISCPCTARSRGEYKCRATHVLARRVLLLLSPTCTSPCQRQGQSVECAMQFESWPQSVDNHVAYLAGVSARAFAPETRWLSILELCRCLPLPSSPTLRRVHTWSRTRRRCCTD